MTTLALFLLPAALLAQDRVVAVQVERVLLGDGQQVEGGYLVFRDGRVAEIGAAAFPDGAPLFAFPGATACPGFLDPVTELGARGDLQETARSFVPEARAADAMQADHSDFRRAARGGVTTAALSPASANPSGGRLAVVRTVDDSGASVIGDGPQRMALVGGALDPQRAPTSRMGALAALRQRLAAGSEGEGPCWIDVDSADEIVLALDLVQSAGRELVLLTPREADRVEGVLASAPVSVVYGPFTLNGEARLLRQPGRLAASGVPVAFTGNGDAAALRRTAALAIREGMDPAAALAALTSVPARLLGIADDVGSLAAGHRADVLVFDGDPLDLGAPLRAVFVDGAPVERKLP